jgi:hypothetical protein
MLRKQQAHKETPQIQDLSLHYMPKISNAHRFFFPVNALPASGGNLKQKDPKRRLAALS